MENEEFNFNDRIEKLKNHLDGVAVITGSTDIFYFTGFMANGIDRLIALVIDEDETTLIVPSLHANEVKNLENRMNVIVWNDGQNPSDILRNFTNRKKVYLEGSMPVKLYRSLDSNEMEIIDDKIEELRSVKDASEIAHIERAAHIAEKSLGETIEYLKEGITEREIASILERKFDENGGEGLAFPTIVSFGENAANPHHMPDKRKLKANEGIVIDFGCMSSYYRSDATRTFFFGHPDSKFTEAYETVREAQESGCNFAISAVSGKEVDQNVRQIIESKGYGKYFTHRTGHGIGLDEHEAPYVDSNNVKKFQPGNCITIEPGIYIPGSFGIRIEDILVVGSERSRNLSTFSRDLTTI
ncbi:MAG: M24 family metallopeptidase [Thermoplasmata archaeon]